MSRHKPHRPKLRSLYQWHRYLGLSIAALVLPLALTGLLLNHTEALGLRQHHVRSPWLLEWYGIQPPAATFYALDGRWLSQWGHRLFLDERELGRSEGALLGAVSTPQFIAAASADTLFLFTPEGQLIERMGPAEGLPTPLSALAVDSDGALLLQTPAGTLRGDDSLGSWQPGSAAAPWSRAAIPPSELQRRLQRQHIGNGLPLERVLLDLHSGRMFGGVGVLLVDLAALGLIFAAASGSWMWWRQRQGRRHRRSH